jgi:FMN-dependent NADH-azoreductase
MIKEKTVIKNKEENMNKVLYIKANAKPYGESRTFKISDKFVEEYMRNNPEDEIITLDLYEEGIKPLSTEDIDILFGPKTDDIKNHSLLKYVYQFIDVDKYIIAEPLWNLGIPAILKAYIDYICVIGITFKYTEMGPIGLCENKKAINITTRGGEYSIEPFSSYEMGDKYLRTIFGFLGISDFSTIAADELDVENSDIDAILSNALKEATEFAKTF